MNVKMLETRRGTADGFALRQYHEGKAYDLPEVLASSFLKAGYAELTSEQPKIVPFTTTAPSFAEEKARCRAMLEKLNREAR